MNKQFVEYKAVVSTWNCFGGKIERGNQRVKMGFHREHGFMVPGNKIFQHLFHGNKLDKNVG
jgi:hypothetical protein